MALAERFSWVISMQVGLGCGMRLAVSCGEYMGWCEGFLSNGDGG